MNTIKSSHIPRLFMSRFLFFLDVKLGMYRHPDIATENWIFLDELTITKQAVR